jgi:hypothetical protein
MRALRGQAESVRRDFAAPDHAQCSDGCDRQIDARCAVGGIGRWLRSQRLVKRTKAKSGANTHDDQKAAINSASVSGWNTDADKLGSRTGGSTLQAGVAVKGSAEANDQGDDQV